MIAHLLRPCRWHASKPCLPSWVYTKRAPAEQTFPHPANQARLDTDNAPRLLAIRSISCRETGSHGEVIGYTVPGTLR